MSDQYLDLTGTGAVRVLTITRPEKLNALNRATLAALRARLDALADEAALRVLIVTGAGPKAFVAGADIAEFDGFTADAAAAYARAGQAVFDRLESMPVPTIAAINGYALGGGCELALACTFRLMADTARLGLPETSLGLIPGFGGTQRLARAIGRQQALELILTGRQVSADEAVRLGIVLRSVPAAALMDEAQALADQLAARAPLALRYAREAIADGLDRPLADGLAAEARLFGLAAATEDMREGVRAFLEKRPATFTGR
ncbi:3-hydroxybutyryl-CoA dehydratase [Luteitalea sp. TBR-22]|uniref:enoyl-CoA hydratase/isomerase family protein n=1 Tax=Luteitalea sp. TBR-22 TaxID=2802971 RepID=UPI001AF28708|nr:enoyl-CoA hydratase-related protein [Luteitalea sp. TBR-22]BCS34147.1 3-hydroxybutyryl-CoA dehydratase [Luteitalea sp. TBR-22]